MAKIPKISSFLQFFSLNKLYFGPSLPHRSSSIWHPERKTAVEPRQYEVSRDPEEWKYVTKLLNKRTVPPLVKKDAYPSGWVPPSEKATNEPYFVERTKNHMLPLYIAQEDRGQRKITVVKKVQGDIWKLHDELKTHIETMHQKRIASQILECNSAIKFKGDHYHWVEQFLFSKGF